VAFPAVDGPSFADRLRGLLPPEQTLPPVARLLTGRAAEQLARQPRPVAANGPGEGRSVDMFVVDGGAVPATDYANGLVPAPPTEFSAAQLHAVLGHAQRLLGAPLDSTLAEGLRLLGREPLSAPLLRPAERYQARRAEAAYRRLAA
jgi:hypothetical protein